MPPRKKSSARPARPSSLPQWDLSDLYAAPDAPDVARDFSRSQQLCAQFRADYEGKVRTLPAEGLAKAIAEYETIQELTGRLGTYAYLCFAKQQTDPAIGQFYQNVQEKLTDCASQVLFFTLAINKIGEEDMAAKLKDEKLKKYAPWLRDVRAFRPYQLTDDLELLLHEKQVAGRTAWTRLFDETLSAMRFPVGQKKLTEAEAMHLMTSRDAKTRKKAAIVIGDTLKGHAKNFALITNTLAKDKEIEDRWRGFARPISSRNVSNYIEDRVVEALLTAVRNYYPRLSHRYYAMKARWFNKKRLDYWDRNAPLPFDADRSYTWVEARDLVLESYASFSPRMAEIGRQFFDKKWIDAAPAPGKDSGAFSHGAVPSVHPYILMNFQGRSRDVMTLAHELGHGVHQVLSGRQGALMADTPLTLAETASVFGEQITFREMVKRETNPKRRKALIACKVEDMLNTVVRQVAFCTFEVKLHNARKAGELTAEQISELWMEVQGDSLGPAINLHGNYRYFWTYIPHFIHSPFYVYAYAFGDCLVNSLYAAYEQAAHTKSGAAEFEKKYIAMLQAGGSLRHQELLAPFGLNATEPGFWQKGLGVIAGFIEELEG